MNFKLSVKIEWELVFFPYSLSNHIYNSDDVN